MIGRVIAAHRASYEVKVGETTYLASVRGHFHQVSSINQPKVGDYIEASVGGPGKLVIDKVLPRHGVISRQSADGEEQVMVVNVDCIFIIMGLDNDFNLNRLERYLTLAHQSNVKAVIVLNKADQVEDTTIYVDAVKAVVGDSPVRVISATSKQSITTLAPFLKKGETIVLLGSSGAGKSTLTNTLLGTLSQATGMLREHDGRGVHTTTVRRLLTLPAGAFLIDTPGLRELGVRTVAEEIAETFPDLATLAKRCQFTNCDHHKSEGCALQSALARGEVEAGRVKNYLKILNQVERVRYQRYRD